MIERKLIMFSLMLTDYPKSYVTYYSFYN